MGRFHWRTTIYTYYYRVRCDPASNISLSRELTKPGKLLLYMIFPHPIFSIVPNKLQIHNTTHSPFIHSSIYVFFSYFPYFKYVLPGYRRSNQTQSVFEQARPTKHISCHGGSALRGISNEPRSQVPEQPALQVRIGSLQRFYISS